MAQATPEPDLSPGESKRFEPGKPFVGNAMWVTMLNDPDGYRISFESFTDQPEDSELSE